MNVIAPRVDCNYMRIEIPQDCRSVRAKWIANGLGQNGLAVLGAEDEMNQIFGQRLRHRKIPAPLQGANGSYHRNPGRCPGLSPVDAFSVGRDTATFSKPKTCLIIQNYSLHDDAQEFLFPDLQHVRAMLG